VGGVNIANVLQQHMLVTNGVIQNHK